jgi:hypothetical protein
MLAEPKLAQAEEEQLPVIINELRAKRVRVDARTPGAICSRTNGRSTVRAF